MSYYKTKVILKYKNNNTAIVNSSMKVFFLLLFDVCSFLSYCRLDQLVTICKRAKQTHIDISVFQKIQIFFLSSSWF